MKINVSKVIKLRKIIFPWDLEGFQPLTQASLSS
jgi:hypothetical protein